MAIEWTYTACRTYHDKWLIEVYQVKDTKKFAALVVDTTTGCLHWTIRAGSLQEAQDLALAEVGATESEMAKAVRKLMHT
jgi:hypothetical protein